MILGIDSASNYSAVALGGEEIIIKQGQSERNSEELLTLIEGLRQQSPDFFSRISAVAVNIGPGSYTGLRVGLALAQGYALALALPIYTVSSFLQTLFSTEVVLGEQEIYVQSRAGEALKSRVLVAKEAAGYQISELSPLEIVHMEPAAKNSVRGLIRAVREICAFFPCAESLQRQYGIIAATDPCQPFYGKAVQAKTVAERMQFAMTPRLL
jgi:tRNA threonylcarbamoyl adenosine modification protein YeaZ